MRRIVSPLIFAKNCLLQYN